MTIHIEFTEHKRSKYGRTDYTFLDRHTSEEIAFGSYNDEGDFEVISLCEGGVDTYISAAVAWTAINRKLIDKYAY